MKKLTKLILSLALVLTVLASATNYQAAETSGKVTYVNGALQATEINLWANAYAPELNWQNTVAGDYGWWYAMLLENDPATGVWTVVKCDTPDGNPCSVMQTGKVGYDEATGVTTIAILFHSLAGSADANVAGSGKYAADYTFFSENCAVGTKFELEGDLMSVAVDAANENTPKEGAISGLTFKLAESKAPETTTTPDAGSNNAGSNNAGSNVPSTGDATPVVAMGSMLFVAVACVALGLKKRNA